MLRIRDLVSNRKLSPFMIRWLLYPLCIFFLISTIANLVTQDWSEALLVFCLFLTVAIILSIIEIRWNVWSKKHREQLDELRGLEHCPISSNDLRELFCFLDRPDPPPCRKRLCETFEFLQRNELELEKTLMWLEANGAGCDCEVIFNTAQKYGPDVGFEPFDDSDPV